MVGEAAQLVVEADQRLTSRFRELEEISRTNTKKVLSAFWAEKVSESDLYGSTGYGYTDLGRDKLEHIYARVFGGQGAIVRPQLVSGTHALKTALFGILRPGDRVLVGTGTPYDTLEGVLGLRKTEGSLVELGVSTDVVAWDEHGKINLPALLSAMRSDTKLVMLQKSRGYQSRASLRTATDLATSISAIKERDPNVLVLVDNCYGEFVETLEPCNVGADVVAGSLIKNPGGGLATTGGYIVGRRDVIDTIGAQLIAPGVGLHAGPTHGFLREFYQGLFMAPHTVKEAQKTSLLLSSVLESLGYEVDPSPNDDRGDLILSVALNSPSSLLAFCRAIQGAAPIDAHVTPQDSSMPGYEDAVVMAAGTFVQGSSIELSADGPMRPPYIAYVQGALTYEHGYVAAGKVAETLLAEQRRS